MKRLSPFRLFTLTALGFALTFTSNTFDPLLVHKLLRLAPENVNTVLGIGTFLGLLVAALTQPIMGALSDRTRSRLGRRLPYLLSGAAGVIACLFLVALAPTLGAVVAGILLIQLASNTVQGPWQALIPDQAPEEQRGRAAGLKSMLDILAVVLGSLSAGQLIGRFPQWGQLALIAAVSVPAGLYLVMLAFTAWGARERPDETMPLPEGSVKDALRNAFAVDFKSHPAFSWWFVNRLLFWAAFIALNTFLLVYLVRVVGMAEADAQRYYGTLKLVLGGMLAAVALPSGWLADKIGRKPLVTASGFVAGAGTLLVLMARSLPLLTAAGAVIGLGVGTFISASWALITDIVPRDEAARYMGLANIATAGGSGLARLLGGVLIDPLNRALGSQSAGYTALFGLAGLFFVLGAVSILPLPSPQPPAAEQPLPAEA